MNLILIYFKSNAIERYGEVCALRQAMLFVFIPDRTATYDANGYITGVSYNGDAYTYTYDNVGRLTQETKNGEVVGTYTYDDKNNVQKTGLTYTNGKLTAVNGAQIVYDDMGNPTTYKGKTLVWEQGRKLTKITSSGKTVTYSYDGNGMRYKKIVGSAKTDYYPTTVFPKENV